MSARKLREKNSLFGHKQVGGSQLCISASEMKFLKSEIASVKERMKHSKSGGRFLEFYKGGNLSIHTFLSALSMMDIVDIIIILYAL